MIIKLKKVTIRDLVQGYLNDEEEGVVAYNGNLNVRPKYQREFVYNLKEQKAVINTALKGFPLNVMYWVSNGDDTYEVLDGQQRTLSLCEFVDGKFPVEFRNAKKCYIHTLRESYPEAYADFMNYELLVYECSGSKDEQLEWFTTINIAGKELTSQELRNINYTGEWLTSAKRYFSKNKCAASLIAQASQTPYIGGTPNRQEILELVLRWITDSTVKKDEDKICDYMACHQKDNNADELWDYFNNVLNWVKTIFPNYEKEMKRDDWGFLYNKYHEDEIDIDELNERLVTLYADEDVTDKKGIYPYLFDGDPSHLSLRTFKDADKATAYFKQKGICPKCGKHFSRSMMEADHIVPWSKGGKTIRENLQMLCKTCNKDKSSGE